MTLELTEHERAFLVEVLETLHPELLHELHHTDAHDYRVFLRKRLETLESLTARIAAIAATTDSATR